MKQNTKLLIVLLALALFAAAIYFVNRSGGGFPDAVLSDFAIEDTSSIDRIFIADYEGGTIDLKRIEGKKLWTCNDKFSAKEHSIRILLECFKEIEVKGKVTESMRGNVIANIASRGTKVEIYTNGKLNKVYLIGTCTQDQQGTFMVLEHANGHRSTEPLIVDKQYIKGCLRQRFFTVEEDWRHTGIYEYPNLEIKKVKLTHQENPSLSYSIGYNGGNDIKLYDFQDNDIPNFDTLLVKDYLLLYKKVHFETYESYLTQHQEDSILKVDPVFTFEVTDNKDVTKRLDLYWMLPVKDYELPDGSISPWDLENLYGKVGEKEIGRVQTYVFNPLLKELSYFLGRQ